MCKVCTDFEPRAFWDKSNVTLPYPIRHCEYTHKLSTTIQ